MSATMTLERIDGHLALLRNLRAILLEQGDDGEPCDCCPLTRYACQLKYFALMIRESEELRVRVAQVPLL